MELWDLYDKDRRNTGKTVERGGDVLFEPGTYHLVVHVLAFSSDGRMLSQQRQRDKETYPNMWAETAAGSAVSGEDSRTAAQRELFEEIGLHHDFSGERPHITIYSDTGIHDFYIIEIEAEPDTGKLVLQPEEVQAVKWLSLGDIKRLKDSGEFVPFHTSFLELCFALRKRRGTLSE